MLKYLIEAIEGLSVAVSLTAALLAYAHVKAGPAARKILLGGVAAGLVSALVMTVLKNATNMISTGIWNLRIYTVSLIALILFLLFSIPALRRLTGKAGDLIEESSAAVLAATYILYSVPAVLTYPYEMLVAEKTLLSTAYILKFIGWTGGIVLVAVLGLAVYNSMLRLENGTVRLLMILMMLVNAARQVGSALSTLLAKRIIPSNHTLFSIARFVANHEDLFIYLNMLILLAVPVILWSRSFHVNEPYRNPAEHRKIRAKWRSIRRWATAALVCMGLSVFILTGVKAYATRPVELSPIEETEIVDGNVYVPADKVSDGHLHRFAYTSDAGVEIRFIVIQKPGSTSYGIGLDACDICGETGYYEKDGQVVCKLCDVVMNINTIGFKGGCNPIVIPYEIKDKDIYVPIEGLLEYENEFK